METKTEIISKGWDTKADTTPVCDGCPEMKDVTERLVVSDKAMRQIKTLCRKYESLEWLGGMKGRKVVEKDEDDSYWLFEEIVLYEQEVSGVTVELTDKGNVDMAKDDLIGWIHSHNTMNVFLSGTDVETFSFLNITLVVNNKLEFEAKIRRKLSCGRNSIIDVDVSVVYEENDEIAKISDKLVIERTYTTARTNYNVFENSCLYCYSLVGTKKRREVNGGVVHKKCYDRFLKMCAEEDDETSWNVPIEDRVMETTFPDYCMECEQVSSWCRCFVQGDKDDIQYYPVE